jgi:hypothetical protein
MKLFSKQKKSIQIVIIEKNVIHTNQLVSIVSKNNN